MILGPSLLTAKHIDWVLEKWLHPSNQEGVKGTLLLKKDAQQQFVAVTYQDLLSAGKNTDNILVQQVKYFSLFVEELLVLIRQKSQTITLIDENSDVASLYAIERRVSQLHGLEILSRRMQHQLLQQMATLKVLLKGNTQEEALVQKLNGTLTGWGLMLNELKASQKLQLCNPQQVPMAIFRLGDILFAPPEAQMTTLLMPNQFEIGHTEDCGGVNITAHFSANVGRSAAYFASPLNARIKVYLTFEETHQELSFTLSQFWPLANLSTVYQTLRTNAERNVPPLINYLLALTGDGQPPKINLGALPHDTEYLESLLSGQKNTGKNVGLPKFYHDFHAKQQPAFMMVMDNDDLGDFSNEQIRMAYQVAIEMAYLNGAEGVYTIAHNIELLSCYALGFRQEAGGFKLNPGKEPDQYLQPSDEALDARLKQRCDTGQPFLLEEDIEYYSNGDTQDNKRVMYLDKRDFGTRAVVIPDEPETTTWEQLCTQKPVIFRDRRGQWPNIKGLSVQPDVTVKDLMKRQITGRLPSTQDFVCSELKGAELFSLRDLMQRGRLGVTQFGKVVNESVTEDSPPGPTYEGELPLAETEQSDEATRWPKSQDNPMRTWRLK